MRRILIPGIAAASLLLAAGAVTTLNAQQWGRPQAPAIGACFYEDIDYGGSYFCERVGASRSTVSGANNQISSIRLLGAVEVKVYQEERFRGTSRSFSANVPDLRRSGWNDRISSLQVAERSYGGGAFGGGGSFGGDWSGSDLNWGRPSTPSTGVCFYQNMNFGGQYFCVRAGARYDDLPSGYDNRITSIRVFGNAEVSVYNGRRFSGRSETFDYDVNNLRSSGFNGNIGSFETRIRSGGGFGGGAFGGGSFGNSGGVIGRVQWRGRVDDRVQISFKGRSHQMETLSGTDMGEGNATFTTGLPSAAVHVSVNKLDGRGTVRVVQQPSRLNGFTAVIEVYDNKGGADDYRIEITWR